VRDVVFLGDSLDEIRAFPAVARREAGFQIERVQNGLDPNDWKPLKTIGPGVREIRIRDSAGAFRVIYLATLADAVYVLHAFVKKTQATPQKDADLAATRLRQLMQRRRND
jgi:phage-related protein